MFIIKGKYVLLDYLYGKMTHSLASYVFIVGDLLSWEQHSFNEIIFEGKAKGEIHVISRGWETL